MRLLEAPGPDRSAVPYPDADSARPVSSSVSTFTTAGVMLPDDVQPHAGAEEPRRHARAGEVPRAAHFQSRGSDPCSATVPDKLIVPPMLWWYCAASAATSFSRSVNLALFEPAVTA